MNSFMMGYPHHHVQAPMGSCMDPKFPPGEDYANGYSNFSSATAHQSPDYLHPHHHQTSSFNHQTVNNYASIGHHFYHHPNHYAAAAVSQTASNAPAATAPANSYIANNYYGSYYGAPTAAVAHNAPIMDLPIQCPPNVEPQNTALGLQELGGCNRRLLELCKKRLKL